MGASGEADSDSEELNQLIFVWFTQFQLVGNVSYGCGNVRPSSFSLFYCSFFYFDSKKQHVHNEPFAWGVSDEKYSDR